MASLLKGVLSRFVFILHFYFILICILIAAIILSTEIARAYRVPAVSVGIYNILSFALLHSTLREIAIIPISEMCKLSQKREVFCQ